MVKELASERAKRRAQLAKEDDKKQKEKDQVLNMSAEQVLEAKFQELVKAALDSKQTKSTKTKNANPGGSQGAQSQHREGRAHEAEQRQRQRQEQRQEQDEGQRKKKGQGQRQRERIQGIRGAFLKANRERRRKGKCAARERQVTMRTVRST